MLNAIHFGIYDESQFLKQMNKGDYVFIIISDAYVFTLNTEFKQIHLLVVLNNLVVQY